MFTRRILWIISLFVLLLSSASVMSYERSCKAHLAALVPNGDRIMLTRISAKGQDSNANKAREEARDRAFACFKDLVDNRFAKLGARYAAEGPSSCQTSNVSGLNDTEVDIETKIRIAACTTYRHLLEAGIFYVHYEVSVYGNNYCGVNESNKYGSSRIYVTSPIWPKDFCRKFGFDFRLPY